MTGNEMTQAPGRKSDFGVRTLSAVVMLLVAGVAVWAGGVVFQLFVAAVAMGVFWEWCRLALRISTSVAGRAVWIAAGAVYVLAGAGALILLMNAGLRGPEMAGVMLVLGVVICTDVGAYFSGRAIGGPKIAPSISPSKTWAGLAGGMIAAGVFLGVYGYLLGRAAEASSPYDEGWGLPLYFSAAGFLIGALLAVVAQAGDFFESWMKRRAGVKDSSNLIPGHGGLFDRIDGLLPVAIVSAISIVILAVASGR
jgi:phosphatidate cytidylyltransferase